MGPWLLPKRVGVQGAPGAPQARVGAAPASPPRKGAGCGCGCGAGRAPATWQCKQEGQRPWHQEPGRQRSVGGGSFLPSPAALGVPATGRGVGSSGAPLPGKRHWVGPRSRATVVISLSAGCWKGRGASRPPLWPGPDAASTPPATRWFPTVPMALLLRPPPPNVAQEPHHYRSEPLLGVRSLTGARVPPFSRTSLCLPHGCADGPSVPVLDTVWFSLGEGSWDRLVVPGAREDRVKGGPQDGSGGRPAEGSRPAFLS